MTVGGLSRRTGLSIKAIREYEGLGLIYSAGRSEAGYRLFGESALRCAETIGRLRSLGLTIREIQQLASSHTSGCRSIGPQLADLLDQAERRIETTMTELEATRRGIRAYLEENAAALAGEPDADLVVNDPRRSQATDLTLTPGREPTVPPTSQASHRRPEKGGDE